MKTMRIRRSGFFLLISLSLYYSLTYAQNYDETKVDAYSLPPLFKNSELSDKKLLKNWKNKRREETLHLFEENIYGQMPKTYDSIQYQITNENQLAINGNATLKQVDIEVFNHKNSVTIHLVLFEPNSIAKAPVFLLINHRGTQLTDATRKTKSDFWPAELLIDRGYAIATFQVNDVAPDNVLHYKKGVLQLYPEQLTAKDGMRAIGAWAWGASRVMDYFEGDTKIDSKKVAVIGHSRGGKAALWAAAEDQRFALCISNCSGNSGAALSRRDFGETIQIINDRFPH